MNIYDEARKEAQKIYSGSMHTCKTEQFEAYQLGYRHCFEQLNKPVVMQAGSAKQPYFKLSTNEFGKHWLFYKPLESEPGKYGCWIPIDDEFYSEFHRMQKAALGSEAAVGQRSGGKSVSAGNCDHEFILVRHAYRCKKCNWWQI